MEVSKSYPNESSKVKVLRTFIEDQVAQLTSDDQFETRIRLEIAIVGLKSAPLPFSRSGLANFVALAQCLDDQINNPGITHMLVRDKKMVAINIPDYLRHVAKCNKELVKELVGALMVGAFPELVITLDKSSSTVDIVVKSQRQAPYFTSEVIDHWVYMALLGITELHVPPMAKQPGFSKTIHTYNLSTNAKKLSIGEKLSVISPYRNLIKSMFGVSDKLLTDLVTAMPDNDNLDDLNLCLFLRLGTVLRIWRSPDYQNIMESVLPAMLQGKSRAIFFPSAFVCPDIRACAPSHLQALLSVDPRWSKYNPVLEETHASLSCVTPNSGVCISWKSEPRECTFPLVTELKKEIEAKLLSLQPEGHFTAELDLMAADPGEAVKQVEWMLEQLLGEQQVFGFHSCIDVVEATKLVVYIYDTIKQ